MKTIISCITALIMLLAPVIPVSAETVCSAGMISHTYGIVGSTIAPDGVFCGIAGIITLKKNGDTSGRVKLSCGGMVEKSTGEGTITVRGNCTADADLIFDDGSPGAFHFAIVDGGKTLLFVGEQPGLTFVGTAQRL